MHWQWLNPEINSFVFSNTERVFENRTGPRAGYGLQTWQIDDGPGAFAAVGLAGQLNYVHPSSRTVIVKLSYHPTVPPEHVQPETLAYLKAIAHTPSP